MRETLANHISEEEKISKMFVSHPVMPDSLRPHELWLIRLLCLWNSPGKNTGEHWSGLPFPSPGNLPNPGIKPWSPHCRQILYCLSHQGNPKIYKDPLK